jgi:putative transposase
MSDTMGPMATEVDQQELAQQLLAQAREQGIDLVGPDGFVEPANENVLETALEAEMDEHLGYEKHDVSGRGSGNSRNGTGTKTVLTEIGQVEIDVPRDTGSTFDPQIVRKRQRWLTGVDEILLSLSAKGLTTGKSRPTSARFSMPGSPKTRWSSSRTGLGGCGEGTLR